MTNGIIQGDSFSLLCVLMTDPLVKILKKVEDDAEILYYIDDLKVSMANIDTASDYPQN